MVVANTPPGPGVDATGQSVVDPTENVKAVVATEVRRIDDIAALRFEHMQKVADLLQNHAERLAVQRADCDRELREAEKSLRLAESARIDAIRSVDVGAVQRAAEVQAQQALTLATQVSTSAEALRAQVVAAASAQDARLNAALDPIQKRIDDLTRAQYEAQGQKTQVIEQRGATGAVYAAIGLGISFVVAVLIAVTFVIARGG